MIVAVKYHGMIIAEIFHIFKCVFYTIYLFREVVISNIMLKKLSLRVDYLNLYNIEQMQFLF